MGLILNDDFGHYCYYMILLTEFTDLVANAMYKYSTEE